MINFKTAKVKFHVQPYKYLVFEPSFVLEINDETSLKVANKGFEVSKPIITLYGTGTIQLLVNGLEVCSVNIEDEYITIDSEQEEAYFGSTLKFNQNRGGYNDKYLSIR